MPEAKAHIIDDDDAARDSLAFLLSAGDVPAASYASAAELLAVAMDARGCVVTDVRMPEMDGLELVHRLTQIGVALPVIVMTGHADVPLAIDAMRAGVADFIEKPFDDELMLSAIHRALAAGGEGEARAAERRLIDDRLARLSGRERD